MNDINTLLSIIQLYKIFNSLKLNFTDQIEHSKANGCLSVLYIVCQLTAKRDFVKYEVVNTLFSVKIAKIACRKENNFIINAALYLISFKIKQIISDWQGV